MVRLPKFGGLDFAKRVDNSAFEMLVLKEGVLLHSGEKVWPHTDYKIVIGDMVNIQIEEKMNLIGADATGVGDAVLELFPRTMQHVIRPIKFTQQRKLDMIDVVQALFNNDLLKLHPKYSEILSDEILEQERIKSDAGNLLYRHPPGFHDDRFWALACACEVAAPYVYGRPTPTIAVAERERGNNFDLKEF